MGNFGKIHVVNNVGLISVTLALNPLIFTLIFSYLLLYRDGIQSQEQRR